MSIEPFPLLKRLQVGSYDNCVIVTYCADLYFFEQVVLPTLWTRGCRNNLVVMDSQQYAQSLDTMGSTLQWLGTKYSLWPVPASKAFHPKLILQTTEKQARLIIGSGNLTVRGYSSNWELFSEILHTNDSNTGQIIAGAWKLIYQEAAKGANKAVLRQLEQVVETSGSLLTSTFQDAWPRLLMAMPEQPSLLTQLKAIVGSQAVERLIVVAPFFDARLKAMRELQKVFSAREMIAVVQGEQVSYPGAESTAVPSLAVHEFAPPHADKSETTYLHAKAYVLQTANAEYWAWGSANCSMAALGGHGNFEALLVSKGSVGEGVAALGLGPSLDKLRRIDASRL